MYERREHLRPDLKHYVPGFLALFFASHGGVRIEQKVVKPLRSKNSTAMEQLRLAGRARASSRCPMKRALLASQRVVECLMRQLLLTPSVLQREQAIYLPECR